MGSLVIANCSRIPHVLCEFGQYRDRLYNFNIAQQLIIEREARVGPHAARPRIRRAAVFNALLRTHNVNRIPHVSAQERHSETAIEAERATGGRERLRVLSFCCSGLDSTFVVSSVFRRGSNLRMKKACHRRSSFLYQRSPSFDCAKGNVECRSGQVKVLSQLRKVSMLEHSGNDAACCIRYAGFSWR